ncbi:MAG TPA: hypothetical protein EYO32_09495 [Rhodospirillales bacterium]|nr:hypothetical protein [Rhodospirillales bacterium]HIN76881.1 hypothetical protein [Rhodospirillales bacterium]
MSKKKDWKGTESVARSAAQHERKREYDAMSPEEKKAAQRRQFVGFLKMFQGEAPIIHIDGKAQEHNPMCKEEADLHMACFDGEVEVTPKVKLQFAQYEAMRFPNSKKIQAKLWKAMQEVEEE